jgi:hypothetical protein
MSNAISMSNTDPARKDPNQSAEELRDITTPVHEKNTTQGSEFLDDAIRVKDQPFKYNGAKMQRKDPRSLL